MYQIFVDSAANIPAVLVKKFDIHVISFENYVNGKLTTCFDPNLTPEEERAAGKEYYDAMRAGAKIQTSLLSIQSFYDAFVPALNAGEDVLYFCLSNGISGTYNSARLAVEELSRVYKGRTIRVVDSLNASLAQGILAIYAYELRKKGATCEEAAVLLQEAAHGMNGVFTVGSLKYLAATGRVSNVTAKVGNALNIKPLLKGNKDGVIVQFKLTKGRKKSLNALVDLVCDNIVEPAKQIIGIAHADAYEDSLYVMDKIRERVSVREFINTSYDYCTGAHVGPDTIALFFLAADRELDGRKDGHLGFADNLLACI
ncbi:MAG: DegV family protein [Coriobacteriia bacterium]|nr:DegV family protein [Coriobacteriia bacterium]